MLNAFASLGIDIATGKPVYTSPYPEKMFQRFLREFYGFPTSIFSRYFHLDLEDDFRDDPARSGWSIIVHSDDYNVDTGRFRPHIPIDDEISTLASLRGNGQKAKILLYECENKRNSWEAWIDEKYLSLNNESEKAPYYILIIGHPEKIPFGFQACLQTFAAVGRVCFFSIEAYRRYFRKIIDAAKGDLHCCSKEVLMFAPCHDRLTEYSSEYMAGQLMKTIRNRKPHPGDRVTNIRLSEESCLVDMSSEGQRAVKTSFLGAASKGHCLVYTAGHGLLSPQFPVYNGAIVCPQDGDVQIPISAADIISAEDIPSGSSSFFEAAIFFQFSCFGYGVPANSTISHWQTGSGQSYSSTDQMAHLPIGMLALRKGPLAYVAHVDAALLTGFYDVDTGQEQTRMVPFQRTVDWVLFKNRTIGYSLQHMRFAHMRLNDTMIGIVDEYRKYRGSMRTFLRNFFKRYENKGVETMLRLIDVRNFMLFGDPAVRLPFTKGKEKIN